MNDSSVGAARPSATRTTDFDAIVIGAGISGMFMLYRLRELGLTARVFEAGTNVGGTWYWNRYPGARFDSESWTYGYSFSKELLQEWDWKEQFSPQPDTLEYLNHVADKFDLRRDMQFRSRVKCAAWDEAKTAWTVTLEDGKRATLDVPVHGDRHAVDADAAGDRRPRELRGPSLSSGRWPHTPVDFTGKRVGIIGTGATAIQAIPEIAKTAKQLTVFQRRPNWAAPLHNAKISKAEMEEIKSRYDEIYAHCRTTATSFIHNADPRATFDVSPQEREAFWEKLYAEPGFGIWVGNFRDIYIDEKANAELSAFVARKIRGRVKDPKVAELLIPKDHGFGTRRVPLESGYFEAYNRDNVLLVDVIKDQPIECITPKGVKTAKQEYEFDILIYATGFDGVTGAFDRIDFRGADGVRLKDVWLDGQPRTYLGMLAERFPNLLMVLGPHTARGNVPHGHRALRRMADGARPIHARTWLQPGRTEARARRRVDEDRDQDLRAAVWLRKSNSWQTGVNRNVDGRLVRRVLGYNGHAVTYRKRTDAVAKGGYKEISFR